MKKEKCGSISIPGGNGPPMEEEGGFTEQHTQLCVDDWSLASEILGWDTERT